MHLIAMEILFWECQRAPQQLEVTIMTHNEIYFGMLYLIYLIQIFRVFFMWTCWSLSLALPNVL